MVIVNVETCVSFFRKSRDSCVMRLIHLLWQSEGLFAVFCAHLGPFGVVSRGKQDEGKYKDTVNLPKTTFGMRANSTVKEPEIQKLWEDNQVYKRVAAKNTGVSCFAFL